MMSSMRHLVCALVVASLTGSWAVAQAAGPSASGKAAQAAPAEQHIDSIVAIVNQQVITRHQLEQKADQITRQMKQQNIPVPGQATLYHQVLQQMINEVLQAQEAQRVGIKVTDQQVDQAVKSVADRNRISVERLRHEILGTGMSWDEYRGELRLQIRDDMLKRRFVEDRIRISDSDIDAFLGMPEDVRDQFTEKRQPAQRPPEPAAKPKGPELFELAQILVEVPDYASNSEVAAKRKKAESLLRKLKSGADFAGVAAASSDGPQALEGGDMGIRPLKDWPDLFIQAIKELPAGHITGVLQSGRGFHILKVLRRGYAQQPGAARQQQAAESAEPAQASENQPSEPESGIVTQTHARHILIKTSKIVDDDKARALLEGLRTRIEHGESFAELAKRYSEDASAPQGGDLGWLNPGETVPAFQSAMDALQPGQVSEPVKTPFGWHLIEVEERRQKNMEKEFRRMRARRELMKRRIGPAYEDWLDQLRSQAYIDNRLDKTVSGER